MASPETPADARRWFLAQVQALWPVAGGSVSLRKSPCGRPRCAACAAGEQHASYVLYARRRARRVTHMSPDAIAAQLERAVENGRTLHDLIVEAGERYLRALKAQRRRGGVGRGGARRGPDGGGRGLVSGVTAQRAQHARARLYGPGHPAQERPQRSGPAVAGRLESGPAHARSGAFPGKSPTPVPRKSVAGGAHRPNADRRGRGPDRRRAL
jgi:hypothetical protein